MLKNQRKKLDDEVRRNQRTTVILQAEAAKLKSEIDELILRNSTAEQEMIGFRKTRETKMLEHDTLKLEVNKLKASLSSRSVSSSVSLTVNSFTPNKSTRHKVSIYVTHMFRAHLCTTNPRRADEVSGLENRKYQLQKSMQVRYPPPTHA